MCINHVFVRFLSFWYRSVFWLDWKIHIEGTSYVDFWRRQNFSPETPNLGQIRRFLALCDLEIWRMTLKNNRAPLLSNMKLYVKFHHHMWIQPGVTVRKRSNWVVTSVTLTFDFWPWPFAWTLPWSMVITPENFMMIQWWEHSQKGVTDGQTDRRTDRRTDGQKIPFIELLGRS